MRTHVLFCILLHYSLQALGNNLTTDRQVFDFAQWHMSKKSTMFLCVVKSISMMGICKLCLCVCCVSSNDRMKFEDHLQCPCRKCPIVILLSRQSQLPLHYNHLLLISILIWHIKYNIFDESVALKFAFFHCCIHV